MNVTEKLKRSVTEREDKELMDLLSFTDKQKEAKRSMWKYLFTLYGGARGGGKSRWLRWQLVDYLIKIPKRYGVKNAHVMLASETYPDLKDRQISKIEIEFPAWLGELKTTKATGLGFHLHEEYGSGIISLRNLDDPSKYQSSEFAAVAIDELTKNSYDKFAILRGSMRWPGITRTPFIAATNPGGIGHAWVKDIFIDRNFKRFPELSSIEHEFNFVQSLPSDNPYLAKEYWAMLNTLPKPLREAWVEGSWDVYEGMAFPGFDRNTHYLPTPVDLPASWPRWTATDEGFTNPFCTLWFCKDPNTGRIFIYREVYYAQLTTKEQAIMINENTPPSENINIHYADPSMWAKKNLQGIVRSAADEYAEQKLYLTKGDNDRIGGKRKVDQALSNLADGMPGLLIFPQCTNIARTLPSLPYDKLNVEDVDTQAEDHAYDALRYGLTNEKHHGLVKVNKQDVAPLTKAGSIL